MKLRLVLVTVVSVALTGAACHHQLAPDQPFAPGIEQSVFPIYVMDPLETVDRSGPTGGWIQTRTYWWCTCSYLAPNLIVTSARCFPRAKNGLSAYSLHDIIIRNGYLTKDVKDVLHLGDPYQEGLVAIGMEDAGMPLGLRVEPVRPGERLTVVAFRFRHKKRIGDNHSWDVSRATVATTPVRMDYGPTIFLADLQSANPWPVGAAVLDEQGLLVGIVDSLSAGPGRQAVVIAVPTIRDLIWPILNAPGR